RSGILSVPREYFSLKSLVCMLNTWTAERAIAFAPDANSAKSGRSLAVVHKWPVLGHRSPAIWGECQGSGKQPYRTQIDLSEPAFRCSCPSRKFPCKHGLGLLLLWAENSEQFTQSELPDWVAEWLEARTQRQEQKEAKQNVRTADPEAQAKRAAARAHKVDAGVAELQLWMRDLVRQGLASLANQSYQYWDSIAARMVDAQAPGLARRLRELAGLPHSGAGWPEHLLGELGQLHLLLEGYHRLEHVPLPVQQDIRTQIGFTQKSEEVLAAAERPASEVETCRDRWHVVGQVTESEDRLTVQRLWLWGETSQRPALLLQFTPAHLSLEIVAVPGTAFDAELVFYPSATPLRAAIKQRKETDVAAGWVDGGTGIGEAIASYSRALSRNPWLLRYPLLLAAVTPVRQEGEWWVRDADGFVLSISPRCTKQWQLLALSGGMPLGLFGEWDGERLLPLGAWANEQFWPIQNAGGERS
ncbi:MAG: SWIM zinc finger family protein, partial [Cyanobacteria bacterium P01_F01_bin.33]